MTINGHNDRAVGAMIAGKAEFDSLLAALAALSEDHFGVLPDDVNWGHVGMVSEAAGLLRQALQLLQPSQPSASSK